MQYPKAKPHIYIWDYQNMAAFHNTLYFSQSALQNDMHPFVSTQLTTSHSEFPRIGKTSLIKGIHVFLLKILVFSNLKSTTGLLSLVNFLVINITGEV